MNSTFQSQAISREEFLEKERKKLDKLKEKQRKQIDFLIKNQMQIEDIRRRNEEKKEKLRLLGERRNEDQRRRQLQNEEQKTFREQKIVEMDQLRKEEQQRLLMKFQDKQAQIQVKMQGKQQEIEAKKQKNQEEREKFEQKIEQNREGQQNLIQQMLQNFQRKELENEAKKRQFHEQLQNKFERRRVVSEQKRDQIAQQKSMRQQKEDEKKLEQQLNQYQKERNMQEINEKEEQQRKNNARMRQEKILKVREQFQKSLIDLNQRYQIQERSIYEMLERAKQNRTERHVDKQLKQYEHQVRIEETLNNAKRVEKQNELHRFKILQKISDDNEKILKIQNEKREMARVKAKIQADHEKEKQSIIREMNTLQRYNESMKLDRSIYSNNNNNNDSFLASTFTDSRKADTTAIGQASTPRYFVAKSKLSNQNSLNGQTTEQHNQNGQVNGSSLEQQTAAITPVGSSHQKHRTRQHNFSSPHINLQQKLQTEPMQLLPLKSVTSKPKFKQQIELNISQTPRAPSFHQNGMTPSERRIEEEKRQKMLVFLKQHEDILASINRSQSTRNNPHAQQYNQSSVIRQRQLEYSSSARNHNNFFNFELPEKKPKKLDYKSNKLVKNIISQGYVNDIHTHQKLLCQETNLLLTKEIIAHSNTQQSNGEYQNLQHVDESKLERISKELLRNYQQNINNIVNY